MTDGINTYQRPHPTCPHCGHEMDHDEMSGHDADLYAAAPNEERVAVQCPRCDQEYWIQGGYKPTYTSAFSEEELQ